MARLLGNMIAESANAPGTGTVNLGGAVGAGRSTFSSFFGSGSKVFYVISDGTQTEAGYGTFTSTASPNTISRDTVVWNSVTGEVSPTKLNFTSAVTVWNEVPAGNMVYKDASGNVDLGTGLINAGTIDAVGSLEAAGINSSTTIYAETEITTGATAGLSVGTGGINTTGTVGATEASLGTGGLTTTGSIGGAGTINGGTLAENGYVLIPRGFVAMWSGDIHAIPAGWALCDGTNGTPNMVNRLPLAAGDAIGQTQIPGSVDMDAVNGGAGAPWNLYGIAFIMKL